jgi:hypothetical protein
LGCSSEVKERSPTPPQADTITLIACLPTHEKTISYFIENRCDRPFRNVYQNNL